MLKSSLHKSHPLVLSIAPTDHRPAERETSWATVEHVEICICCTRHASRYPIRDNILQLQYVYPPPDSLQLAWQNPYFDVRTTHYMYQRAYAVCSFTQTINEQGIRKNCVKPPTYGSVRSPVFAPGMENWNVSTTKTKYLPLNIGLRDFWDTPLTLSSPVSETSKVWD
jgi:hypothetical protein